MSKALPNAHKPGKRRKDDGKGEPTKGSESSHKLDPKAPIAYNAWCDYCGSLGSYLNDTDRSNAERRHKSNCKGSQPIVTTGVHGMTNKKNKGQK